MNIAAQLNHPIFDLVREVAQREGLDVYVVGGYVRDLLLNRKDGNKDIDCMVIGNGVSFAEQLCEEIALREDGKKPKLSEFRSFGTAMFHYQGAEIEFVGARKESYSEDTRKPAVENGTLEDDISRRDFTINAMAAVIHRKNGSVFGEIIDLFKGLQDLENQILRTPLDPDITFSDDPLRMLRAIRFASQLYFDIDAETFAAIERNAQRIDILSKERITEELNKILLSPKPSYGFKLLDACGLLQKILPEITALKGIERVGSMAHKDNFLHTLEVLDNVADATYKPNDRESLKIQISRRTSAETRERTEVRDRVSNEVQRRDLENLEITRILFLRWAALLHDIAKPLTKRFDKTQGWTFHGHEVLGARMADKIFRRLKLPQNEKLNYVKKLINLHLRPIILAEDVTDSAVRRLLFDAGDDINDLMLLAKADITSKNREKLTRYKSNLELVEQKLVELEEKDRIRNFQPPIDGEEIIEYFHLSPKEAEEPLKSRIQQEIDKSNVRVIELMAVAIIKTRIKDAILDGKIPNNHAAAKTLMQEIGAELGLKH
ncbi:MAG: CCA tRNA nucleotidyltransferase [Bacteroidales bacterium]|jgi:poly(A) polymerase|nr:CCA tRNA nucleotidyltransferase [Bacteroidales bacterium]